MKRSLDRILTTHVGSLPRPRDLVARLEAKERGGPADEARLAADIRAAVRDVVRRQRDCGIDVVGDGEFSKLSYTFYVRHRLGGLGTASAAERPKTAIHADLAEHPDFLEALARKQGGIDWFRLAAPPACVGPVAYADRGPVTRDIENLRDAAAGTGAAEAFLTASSPGVLTKFVPDAYYCDEDAYLEALADALKTEYDAIAGAGLLLQIDAPDLGSARHNQYAHLTDREFLRIADRNVAALNHATRDIPPERMRMHVCWGNYEGPHTHDVPLKTIFAAVMKARPAGLLIEAANPAHAHEWEDLADLAVPDDKILIPGMIDTTTNFVEHPRLIAQRLLRYAGIVGRERVIAGTDCGFATFAATENPVAPSIVWAKLKSLADGAAIASSTLRGARPAKPAPAPAPSSADSPRQRPLGAGRDGVT